MNLSKFNSYYKSDCVGYVKQLVKNGKFGVHVQDLATRTNIDKEERKYRSKKLTRKRRSVAARS